jgi:hypothetical protein
MRFQATRGRVRTLLIVGTSALCTVGAVLSLVGVHSFIAYMVSAGNIACAVWLLSRLRARRSGAARLS